jgi:pilus assembly protein CpaE
MRNQECRVLLVEDNAVNALLVQKMVKSVESPVFRITHADSLLKALELSTRERFDVALVDLNLPDSHGLDTFLAIQRAVPGLAIVVLSACESDDLALQAVEHGAQDYLSKSQISASELVRALHYSVIRNRKQADEGGQTAANVIGFLGSKGGVGTTTLACHAARELKRQTGEDVLLTGIDAATAGVSHLMLKNQQQYTLGDAAQNLHRLDNELWKALVSTTPDGVDVMPPPGAAQFTGVLEPDRIHQVLRFARGLYRHVVIDLGMLNPPSLNLLDETAHLFVVANEELPALWEAGRLLPRIAQLGIPSERVHFVLNAKKRRGGLDMSELQKAFGCEVYGTVSEAREETENLLADGRFIDVKSQIHKDTAKVIGKLLGKDRPEPAATGFRFAKLLPRIV